MAHERLNSLSLLSIENQRARRVDFNKVIVKFTLMKSRKKFLGLKCIGVGDKLFSNFSIQIL